MIVAYDSKQLLAMSQEQLDDLFRAAPAGDIPNGSANGTAIIAPGTRYCLPLAKVYKAPSWLDGQECIVLDYSHTSLIAQRLRDEIRSISPNFYLGKVYWDKDRLIDFCLQF
jgi:hypothetical protein